MTSLVRRFPFLAGVLASRSDRPTPPSRAADSRPAPPRAAPELEELRGAAMRRLFPKLYSWCVTRWEWAIAMEVHAYLAGATSVHDLEQRIRNVERRRHFHA